MAVTSVKECSGVGTLRKVRAHKKSRKGCGNCKFRKCDEQKPSCKRCEVYGTICDYDSPISDLQPAARGAGTVNTLSRPVLSEKQTVLGIISTATDSASPGSSLSSSQSLCNQYDISSQDLEILYRFHTRTILSLGSTGIHLGYQHIYSKLTYSSAFLFHTVMTLTVMHDQYLGIGSTTDNAAAIAFHWSRAAALLNERLSAGLEASERDALWACAVLLGALSFSIEANTAEEVWPLNPNSDLDWLRMTEGKKAILKIADPTREDSIFRAVRPDLMRHASPNAASMAELERLPPSVLRLCGFDDRSLHSDSPYYGPASTLAQNLDVECTRDNMGRFMSLFGCMNMEYKRLLHQKDPCAMILLAYWYAKLCHCQAWYSWRRAYLECRAICEYLLQKHGHDGDISAAARDIQSKCAAEKPWRPVSDTHAEVRTLRPLPE